MSKKVARQTNLISRKDLIDILEKHKFDNSGRAFTVVFTRRTDGLKRTMNCRYGVVSKLKGGSAPFSFEDKQLHSVYDLVKHDYRSVPLDAVEKLSLDGVDYEVV